MQMNKQKTKEWVNIRVSPSVKYALMELKGKMQMLTYDAVIRLMVFERMIAFEEKGNGNSVE